jgi:hypothetical protein
MGCFNSKFQCNECNLEIGDYNTNYICCMKGLGNLNNGRYCLSCLFSKFNINNYNTLKQNCK